jgi:glycosyltransferase involved in cell wall biosynthesis
MTMPERPPRGELPDPGLVILTPVCDDWRSLRLLLPEIDRALSAAGLAAQVVVVDDGSNDPRPADLVPAGAKAITRTWLISLARNLGHQRAIAIGLAWIQAKLPCAAVVVMDGDGEDNPADISRLVAASREYGERTVVFAQRARRSEGVAFRFAYGLYRLGHRILVGRGIRFGNFSIVPRHVLDRLVSVSELWNHYAAAVLKARLPYSEIPTHRAKRLDGKSKMRVVSLVTHGLSAISVNGEVVGSRLIMAASALAAVTVLAMIIVIGIRFATERAIPGWTTYTLAFLMIILGQAIMAALLFAFVTLSSRNTRGFMPSRDYSDYVMSAETLPVSHDVSPGRERAPAR